MPGAQPNGIGIFNVEQVKCPDERIDTLVHLLGWHAQGTRGEFDFLAHVARQHHMQRVLIEIGHFTGHAAHPALGGVVLVHNHMATRGQNLRIHHRQQGRLAGSVRAHDAHE